MAKQVYYPQARNGEGPQRRESRRGAVDLTGTAARSDYWHNGLPSHAVSRNHSQFPGIHFFTADGVGSGVALTECEYSQGIAAGSQSVFTRLPSELHKIKLGTFMITWPGYQQLKWRQDIAFVHPNGAPLTIAHMAAQIAYHWRRFYEREHAYFNGEGVRLGPDDVTFNHLRLHQIWTNDGRHWQAELSYVTAQ